MAAKRLPAPARGTRPEDEFRGPPYFSFHGIDYSYESADLGILDYTSKAFMTSEYDTYTFDFSQPAGAVSRARVELAILELHFGTTCPP